MPFRLLLPFYAICHAPKDAVCNWSIIPPTVGPAPHPVRGIGDSLGPLGVPVPPLPLLVNPLG